MTDEVHDPNEALAEMNLDDLDVGFTDEDLEDVVDSVRGDRFQYSGIQCRVCKTQIDRRIEESITRSSQKFWIAGVQTDWEIEHMKNAPRYFESDIWRADEMDGWIEVRVGHERAVSREEAEDEAEWLAEQVVMMQNDPNIPV